MLALLVMSRLRIVLMRVAVLSMRTDAIGRIHNLGRSTTIAHIAALHSEKLRGTHGDKDEPG